MGLWTALSCAALGSGCGGKSALDASGASGALEVPKGAIAKPIENGPVKVLERLWPAKPTLGDAIYLRLEIDSAAGTSVNAPFQEAGDQRMGRFRVVGFTRDSHRNGDGGLHEEQTYTLEAPSSGKQRVPPLRFEMVDARAGGSASGKAQEILTDEIPIEIAPVKTEAIGAELKGAVGKLDPDVGGTPWMKILLLLSGLAVLGSGTLLALRAMSARRRVAAQKSAYDEAVGKLRVLEDRGAPQGELVDSWFVELSAIVRDYLERRYEIRAPELTTEEFLLEASRARELTAAHRGLLSAFLERCDRVKFANYRPDSEESLASLKAARAFVEDTRLREEPAALPRDKSRAHGDKAPNETSRASGTDVPAEPKQQQASRPTPSESSTPNIAVASGEVPTETSAPKNEERL